MMGDARRKDYEPIYLGGKNGTLAQGKFKLSPAGVGWKNPRTQQIITIAAGDMKKAAWSRVAKDFEVMLIKLDGSVWKFDGFPREAYEDLASLFKLYYSISLEVRELSLRGYNWGSTEFRGPMFAFNVANKTAFEIPLSDVVTTSVPAKNEVAVELAVPQDLVNGTLGEPGEKAYLSKKDDYLVEMRLYVPGVALEGQVTGTEDGKMRMKDAEELESASAEAAADADGVEAGEIRAASERPALDEEGQAMSAAHVLCETFKQRADVGAPETNYIANFEDVLLLAPRGRFEIRLFDTFFRLIGKSNEYRILYSAVTRLFIMPKPTESQWQFVIALDPPVRQGQTRYPFLVFQIEREDEIELELSLTEEEIADKYAGKLSKSYDGPLYEVLPSVLKGLSGKKLLSVSETFEQLSGATGIKCSLKANEANIYPLERGFLVISKPSVFMAHKDITGITFSRLSSALAKTFEARFTMSNGTEYAFSSIERDMHDPLIQFCKDKNLNTIVESAPAAGYGGDSSDDEGASGGSEGGRGRRKRTGGTMLDDMEEGESSVDEDFVASDGESSVGEEYDEDFQSSSDSDAAEGEGEGSSKHRDRSPAPERKKSSKKSSPTGSPSSGDKKKRAKKDPNAPKRSLSAFFFFSAAKRDAVRQSQPGASVGDIAKIMGTMWKEATAEEKEVYEDQARQDKARYEAEMREFQQGTFVASSKSGGREFKSEEFVNDEDE